MSLGLRSCLMACLALTISGCTYAYQPMSGLHRPYIVDVQADNLRDVRLTVVCVPKDLLSRSQANALCTRMRTLFENQGALVAVTLGEEPEFDDVPEEGGDAVERLDLRLVLSAHEAHHSFHPLTWAAFLVTFTLAPGVIESTFVQEIELWDASGSLLARDHLTGRTIEYGGLGTWLVDRLTHLKRPKGERGAATAASKALSADLYQQLSQDVFDARMRATVLRAATAEASP